jgi:putative PIN family toxin of toxin-antitoxin system
MVDTNVLFSALLFPSPNMTSIFDEIALNHKLVICSYVLEELHGATAEKFPDKVANVERLLSKMSYELVYTPKIIDESLFEIRDMDDYPVLYTATMEDVDILITGDNDYFDEKLHVEKPLILKPRQFKELFVQQ